MKNKVAFIGLGVMGFPMAGHIAKAGYPVTVFNRSKARAVRWCEEYGGVLAASPAAAADAADFIFSCVGNDDDLREVMTGEEGAFKSARPGCVFIDSTTTSAMVARELSAEAEASGFAFLDAPVSGGQAGAESGRLTVMVGGDEEAFNKSLAPIESYAASIKLLGPSGYGQLTKMVNQICVAGLLQGLSEGIHFAMHAGLNVEEVIDVISKGAAQSWQMENRYQTMMNQEFDFGFAVDWMRKDLSIAMQEANNNGAKLPVTQLVDSYYSQIQSMGGNRWDTSSLIALLEQ